MGKAARYTLPRFQTTSILDAPCDGATEVVVRVGNEQERYWTVPEADEPRPAASSLPWMADINYLVPIVRNADGSIWAEGTLYVLGRLRADISPKMSTYSAIADDLSEFKRFVDAEGVDWTYFPKDARMRPTYSFKRYQNLKVGNGRASTTANRALNAVKAFYSALIIDRDLIPSNSPWQETRKPVAIEDQYGRRRVREVKTSDLTLPKISAHELPVRRYVLDERRLRPLTVVEQKAILQALDELGNTEMRLIHHVALRTSARIQTILTLRAKHFTRSPSSLVSGYYTISCGRNTDIDTKGSKPASLHLDTALYEEIFTYLKSSRRARRAQLAGNNSPDQFVFLSQRGMPMYDSQEAIRTGQLGEDSQHAKTGQGVRKFIKDRVIPRVAEILGNPQFHYQFHDLRASFGTNYLSFHEQLISSGDVPYHKVLSDLADLMWHSSTEVTERYVEYRKGNVETMQANDDYFRHLSQLSNAFK